MLQLRNPWGKQSFHGEGTNGLFKIPLADFATKFSNFTICYQLNKEQHITYQKRIAYNFISELSAPQPISMFEQNLGFFQLDISQNFTLKNGNYLSLTVN